MPASSTTTPALRRRKFKALLAGGLVLGVGAAVVLAAWNDSEFATGTFSSGQFDLVGSADGTNFANHAESSPASLSFSVGFDNLAPENTVASPFVLHLDATTTNDADLTVTNAVGTGTAESELTYGIFVVANFASCTPAATGTGADILIPAGTALNDVTGATSTALVKTTNGTDPGADVFLCIQVTSSSDLDQDTTATGTWQFEAVSTS